MKQPRALIHYSDWESFEVDVESIHFMGDKCGGTQIIINRNQIPDIEVDIGGDIRKAKDWLPNLLRIPKEAEFIGVF